MPVVGIDLGTTYSAVSYLDDMKKPLIARNAESSNVTPSVVFFETRDNIVVGEQAKNVSEAYPERTVEFVKNHMGQTGVGHEWPLHGETYRPEQISAMILRKLKADAEQDMGKPITGAVITVPAIFGEAERNATRQAAAIAEIEVIDILDEPVAAALSYGLAQGSGKKKTETILVYDLGGGTFDVTIMRVSQNEFSMLYTDGDRQLGGKLWDDEIMTHVAKAFERKHGTDPHDSPESCQTLRIAAEQAKRALTSRAKAAINCNHAGNSLRVEIGRDEFEQMTARLLKRTETVCQMVMDATVKKGHLEGWEDIDQVLLVGGSSRMPQVPAMVEKLTGKEPRLLDPDLAVAKGAALYSEMKVRRVAEEARDTSELERHGIDPTTVKLIPTAKVNRVCSFALGTKVRDGDSEAFINSILIQRNSTLPAKQKDTFVTIKDSQRSIHIEILEGDDPDPEHCVKIGEGIITGIPAGLPKNSPLDITVELNDESTIRVHAIETTHGTSCTFTLEREVGLDKATIQKAAKELARKTVA
jgi:molecular chaperone DnaK